MEYRARLLRALVLVMILLLPVLGPEQTTKNKSESGIKIPKEACEPVLVGEGR